MRSHLVALLLASTVACGSSPEPTLYALTATRGAVRTAPPKVIKVRSPSLAGYLDRSEIVRHVEGHRIALARNDDWGEPLGEMIGRVLALDLGERLPGSTVFADGGPVDATPDAVVSLDVLRFDAGADGEVVLVTDVSVQPGAERSRTAVRELRLHQRPAGSSPAEIVSTMSDLVAQLSDVIAALVGETA
jgi:uncharacterized lipoprotein YmbA